MENLCHYISLDNLEKAHVKSYERKNKSGKLSQVKEHEDKRTKKNSQPKDDSLQFHLKYNGQYFDEQTKKKIENLIKQDVDVKFKKKFTYTKDYRDQEKYKKEIKDLKSKGFNILNEDTADTDNTYLIVYYKNNKIEKSNSNDFEIVNYIKIN